MDDGVKTLRFEIAGRWTASDMAMSFLHLADLYNLRLAIELNEQDLRDAEQLYDEMLHFPPFRHLRSRRVWRSWLLGQASPHLPRFTLDPVELENLARTAFPHEQLTVRRLEYASPGVEDFAGLGKIVGHIKDSIGSIVQYYFPSRRRRLEDDKIEAEVEGIKADTARKYVQLAKEAGFSEAEVRQMAMWTYERQKTFWRLVQQGKIRNVKLLNEPHQQEEVGGPPDDQPS